MTHGEHARAYAPPPHGTVAEEAAKLAEAAHLWLVARSAADESGPAGDQPEPPECRGCPVCRVRRAVSELNPEVYAHLADAAASLGAALRALDRERGGR